MQWAKRTHSGASLAPAPAPPSAAGDWRQSFGSAAADRGAQRGRGQREGSWRRGGEEGTAGRWQRGRGPRGGGGYHSSSSTGYTSSSDTEQQDGGGATGGVPAGEEALGELNAQLGELRFAARVPLQRDRAKGEDLLALTAEAAAHLDRLEHVAEDAPQQVLCSLNAVLHALGIGLEWRAEALGDDLALSLLASLKKYAFRASAATATARRRRDEETRFYACHALHHLLKSGVVRRRQQVALRFLDLLPESQAVRQHAAQPHLFTLILYDPSTRVRVQAANAAGCVLTLLAPTLAQAEEARQRAASFTSFSEKLGAVLAEAHAGCVHALRAIAQDEADGAPSQRAHAVALLQLLAASVAVTPYPRLPAARAALAEWVRGRETVRLLRSERHTVVATLQVLTAALNTRRPVPELAESLSAAAEVLGVLLELLHPRHSLPERHESLRAWAALARNYPAPVRARWEALGSAAGRLVQTPDQQTKLSVVCFASAATEPGGAQTSAQPSEELPGVEADEFGAAALPPGARRSCSHAAEAEGMRRRLAPQAADGQGGAVHGDPVLCCRCIRQLVLPLLRDELPAVRAHAVAVLGNLSGPALDQIPAEDFSELLSEAAQLLGDVNMTVRGTSARVCGLWLCSSRGLRERHSIGEQLVELLRAPEAPWALQQKLGWALAALCDRLRDPACQAPPLGPDPEVRRELELRARDAALRRAILEACCQALQAAAARPPPKSGAPKCAWQVLRAAAAAGQGLDCEPAAIASAVECCAAALSDPSVKARWNAAAALGPLLRSPICGSEATASAVRRAAARLAAALHEEQNFKVRVQACWALAAIHSFPAPEETIAEVLEGLRQALLATEAEGMDFEQFRFKEVLLISLRGLLLHVLRAAVPLALQHPGIAAALCRSQQVVCSALDSMLLSCTPAFGSPPATVAGAEDAACGPSGRWAPVARDIAAFRDEVSAIASAAGALPPEAAAAPCT
eukprot:TRINITY_DN21842_c0_g3_i1.p1 TRINITY_DN21842_c0_g3~~TRINITY_DN21842_c0_g3_i1.p1  ORF type:complete len:976 (+),score=277.12 TRINITY_DN21842_c0_g3_i1:91-3018(+)